MNKEQENRIDSFSLIWFLFQLEAHEVGAECNVKLSQMPEYVRDLGQTLRPFLSLWVLQRASSASGLRQDQFILRQQLREATSGNELASCCQTHFRDTMHEIH